jgi:hypothetical protein
MPAHACPWHDTKLKIAMMDRGAFATTTGELRG